MLMKSLYMLFESEKPLRRRVEIYVFKGDYICMLKGKNNNYKIPGGGIDGNETFEQACRRESLEEIGIDIKNIKKVSDKTLKVNWTKIKYPSQKVKKRLSKYSGSETFFYRADFDKEDKSTLENSIMKTELIPINKIINMYKKLSKKQNDFFDIRVQMLQKAKRK